MRARSILGSKVATSPKVAHTSSPWTSNARDHASWTLTFGMACVWKAVNAACSRPSGLSSSLHEADPTCPRHRGAGEPGTWRRPSDLEDITPSSRLGCLVRTPRWPCRWGGVVESLGGAHGCGEGGDALAHVIDAERVRPRVDEFFGELRPRAPGEELPPALVHDVNDVVQRPARGFGFDGVGAQGAAMCGKYLNIELSRGCDGLADREVEPGEQPARHAGGQ